MTVQLRIVIFSVARADTHELRRQSVISTFLQKKGTQKRCFLYSPPFSIGVSIYKLPRSRLFFVLFSFLMFDMKYLKIYLYIYMEVLFILFSDEKSNPYGLLIWCIFMYTESWCSPLCSWARHSYQRNTSHKSSIYYTRKKGMCSMTNTYKWKWSSSPDDIYIIPRIFSFVSPFLKIISYFL